MTIRLLIASVGIIGLIFPNSLPAQDTWANPVSGNWTNDALWTDGTAPTAGDAATIAVGGAPYTVSLFTNASVASLTIASADASFSTATGGPTVTLTVGGNTTISAGNLYSTDTFTFATTNGISNVGGLFQSGGHATTLVQNDFVNHSGAELKVRGVRNNQGTASFGAQLTISGALTNDGTLSLETNRGSNGGVFARLIVSGAFANTGTLESVLFEGAGDGGRSIQAASFNNSGSVTNNNVSALDFTKPDAVYENSGTLNAAVGGIRFLNFESLSLYAAGQLTGTTATLDGNYAATSSAQNAGVINVAGVLAMTEFNSFSNSGTISAGDTITITANNLASSSIENTSTGVINFTSGGLINIVEDVANAGALNVNGGTLTVELGSSSGNGQQFVNSGDIEVVPGAVFNLRQQFFGGEGPAVVNLEPGSTLDGGGDIFFSRITGNINNAWAPGASPLNVYLTSLSGTGSLTITDSLIVRGSSLNIPVNSSGITTVRGDGSATSTLSGAFTNASGGIVNADSSIAGFVNLRLSDNDFTNHGQFDLTGNTTTSLVHVNTSTSTGSFINESDGVANITGTGNRNFDVPLDNRGSFNLAAGTTSDRTASTYQNSGTLTASAIWNIRVARSFVNSGNLTSTGGNFDFRFDNDAASHFTNTATGVWTIANGAFIDEVEDVNNAGQINVDGGAFNIELARTGGNASQFNNTGSVTLAPGTSMSIYKQNFGGEGQAVFNFEPGATLNGGGDIFLTRVTGTINGTWAPGASPISVNLTSLAGTGSLAISNSLAMISSSIAIPVSNTGAVNITDNSGNNDIAGAFTNQAAGVVSLDSAPSNAVTARIGDLDFTNHGVFNMTGDTTTSLTRVNTVTSTGVFMNAADGTVNIIGSGNRNWDVPLNNAGNFNIDTATRSDLGGLNYENSGTITAAADWDVSQARSLVNSGNLTSTGGNFDFRFDQNAASHFTNTAAGVVTIANGMFIDNVEDVNNAGQINVTGGTFNIELAVGGGNAQQFNHAGGITLAPGTSMSIYKQNFGGEGQAVFNFEPGATLNGGGDIFLTRVTGSINDVWAPGASPINVALSTLSGIGPLNISASAIIRDTTLNIPVTSSGTTTIQRVSNGVSILGSAFTNAAGGVVNADSSITGAISARLDHGDFTNHGEFNLIGNTTATLSLVNNSTSTAIFVNELTGSVTIDGTGNRQFNVPLDNRGTFNAVNSFTLGVAGNPNSNSGSFIISPGATVTVSGSTTTNESIGIISGTGTLTVSSTAFTNNGVIAPGLSVGTLNATGTVTNGPTAMFPMEITSGGNDLFSVSGSLAVDGTVRPKVMGFIPEVDDEVVVMQCTGTLSGSLQVSSDPNIYPTFSATVDPALKQVRLTVTSIENFDFDDFQRLYFTDEQIANGDAAQDKDFDLDGLTNFLEWVYGEDPTSTERVTPDFQIAKNGGGNYVLLFPQSSIIPPIEISLQSQPDFLNAWAEVDESAYNRTELPLPEAANANLISLEITDPALNALAEQFFQVEFTSPTS